MTDNRLVLSPMSMVAHDDVHLLESIQRGPRAGTNEWVSLHRDFDAAELGHQARDAKEGHQRTADAQPVSRLGEDHDALHAGVTRWTP